MIRRMLILNQPTFKEYGQHLKEHPEELNLLYDDLLINVTKFFREPEANAYLVNLLPDILKNKQKIEPVRIWVPACSAGQEAYSLAMLLFEVMGVNEKKPPIQIFGTDISEKCINKARIGIYTKNEMEDVSPQRLHQFFDATETGYRVKKSIREVCLFAAHNILTDPPFSRMDLISCCNFLIYLKSEKQQKVIYTFHYALQSNGYLLLGKSETIGNSSKFFKPADKDSKKNIFIKEFSDRVLLHNYPFIGDVPKAADAEKRAQGNTQSKFPLSGVVDDLLLTKYIPSSVVINKEMEILQFRGSTSLYLEPAPGVASFNLIKMARAGLRIELRNAIHKSIKSGQITKKEGLEINFKGVTYGCGIEVVPLDMVPDGKYFLILFRDFAAELILKSNIPEGTGQREKKLEKEITTLREDMTSIIEAREAAVEELQTANEEIISSNEELQTINEELQTSKEEIESSNEELTTINEQLQLRNDQLNELYNYTDGIITTITEAMIVLDKNLIVRSANQSFYDIFKTTAAETEGLYLFDLGNGQWNIPKLHELLLKIIPQDKQFKNFEVTHRFPLIGTKTMLLNAKQLVQKAHSQELIFLAIQDITSQVEAAKIIKEREQWFHNLANNAPINIWVAGTDKQFTFFNDTWYAFTGRNPEEELGNGWMNGINKDDIEHCTKTYDEAFDKKQSFRMEYRLKRHDGVFRWILHQGKPTYNTTGEFSGYIGTSTDIDDQKMMDAKKDDFLGFASHELRTPLTTAKIYIEILESLLKKEGSEKAILCAKNTGASIEKINKLVKELLDVTKLQHDRMSLNVTGFNLETLLNETINSMHASFPEYNIALTGKAGNLIHADYDRLQQVLTNLLSNAIKYSPDSKKIEVQVSDKNDELLVAVIDHGVGINQNHLMNIFEKFYREEVGSFTFPGLGVGLFISAEIIKWHNGRIWAESTLGNGSKFYFTIPVNNL
jgi:two-component system CheB/CheR fusion protein